MKIENKIILSQRELKDIINEAILRGIFIGNSEVYKSESNYKKIDISFINFLEHIPTKLKLFFEEE